MTFTPPVTFAPGQTGFSSNLNNTVTALAAYTDTAPPIGQRLIRAMESDQRDVSILVVGDSTSSYSTSADLIKWPFLLGDALFTRFPKYTIKHATYTGSFFQTVGTLHTGSGTHTLWIVNGSHGGTGPRWHQVLQEMWWDARLWAVGTGDDPDLTFVSHGHNNGSGSSPEPFRNDLLALTETLTLAMPGTEIVLCAQNPRVNTTDYNAALRHEVMRVSQIRGFGFVDAWRAFVAASPGGVPVAEPTSGALIVSDGIHPNSAGYTVWANAIIPRLVYTTERTLSQQPSSFSFPAVNRLANGDFSSFASPPTLPSWTATNATLSKDVTNFESGQGYAVKITPASAAASYISQSVVNLKECRARRLTVAARMFATAAVKTASASASSVSIVETGGSSAGETISTATVDGQDGFLWITTSRFIAHDATGIAVRVYGDTAAVSGSVVTVDRVVLALGGLPRDLR